jgi:uncharacterized protein with PhoU and TrkA domain
MKKKKFIYQPLSIKDILKEMKEKIDLMMDLSLSAVMLGNKQLAQQATKIEARIHELTFLLNFQLIQTHTGGFNESKSLEPIMIMGYSIDKIADALTDIAHTVDIVNLTPFSKMLWEISQEHIIVVNINEGSSFIGQKLEDLEIRAKYNLDLVALHQGNKWILGEQEIVQVSDQLIVRGELPDLEAFAALSGETPEYIKNLKNNISSMHEYYGEKDYQIFKTIRKDFLQIIDLAESMVDIAFAALFFSNTELAEDIVEMEETMDVLNLKFERNILSYAHNTTHHADLEGILRIVFSCELISDACQFMVENILFGFEVHPILKKAFAESGETVVRELITERSYFKGKKYAEVHTKRYSRGFYIVAIRRDGDWIYNFTPDFILKENDLLIGIGPQETVDLWRRCVNPLSRLDQDDDE